MQSHCAKLTYSMNVVPCVCCTTFILLEKKRALSSSKGHQAAISTCLRQPQFYIQFIYNPHFGT